MAVKIGVSTGVFYKYYKENDLNNMITALTNLDVDVIEILFARPFMLDIDITSKNKDFLKTKRVIIHGPFFHNELYNDLVYSRVLIKKLINKCKELNALHIIMHLDLLGNVKIPKEYSHLFAFENLKKERKYTLEYLKNWIKEGNNIKISLDIGHLQNNNYSEYIPLINEIKENIVEIQLSIKEDYENFLKGNVNKKYGFIKDLGAPIVLETRPKQLSDLSIIIKNLKFWEQNDS